MSKKLEQGIVFNLCCLLGLGSVERSARSRGRELRKHSFTVVDWLASSVTVQFFLYSFVHAAGWMFSEQLASSVCGAFLIACWRLPRVFHMLVA